MRRKASSGTVFVGVMAVCALSAAPSLAAVAQIREITAAGPEANAQAGITATVAAFQADLGSPNNGNAVGSQPAGRSGITWDGADNDSAPARLPPLDFFNAIAPRGLILFGGANQPPLQFQQSADATPSVSAARSHEVGYSGDVPDGVPHLQRAAPVFLAHLQRL